MTKLRSCGTQIQTDNMWVSIQPDIVAVDKQEEKAIVVDVSIPSQSDIRKKEREELKKYQGLKEELEKYGE